MSEKRPEPVSGDDDLWSDLRRLTAARIGLQRSGASLATAPLLGFKLDHARARDAVHEPLDEARLIADLEALGTKVLSVASAAADRKEFLMRPDLGRRLAPGAEPILVPQAAEHDVVFVIADGLSARAVQSHASEVVKLAHQTLQSDGWRIAPLVVVRHGRVAVGDAIAALLHAKSIAMLIGERPGLTAPDSMGAYLTWQPGSRTTDADRNCISNIRPDGIGYADAAFKIAHLLRAMRTHRMSGVQLKDDSDRLLLGERP
jgi:ethanolamine ammonia-lyase small subunit